MKLPFDQNKLHSLSFFIAVQRTSERGTQFASFLSVTLRFDICLYAENFADRYPGFYYFLMW